MRAQVLAAAGSPGDEPKRRETHEANVGVIALIITETLNPYVHEIVQGAQNKTERTNLFSVVVNARKHAVRRKCPKIFR